MGEEIMKWKPSAGHIMMELLYGVGDHIQHKNGNVVINITKMAKVMFMRPVRLLGAIEWLREISLLEILRTSRYTITIHIKAPEGFQRPPNIPDNPEDNIVSESTSDTSNGNAPKVTIRTPWTK